MRRWLLELIGEVKSAAAMPLLNTQLNSPDEPLRGWAAASLEKFDKPQARYLLWQARANGVIS